jgi:excisionase family DNA binding protein
MSPVLLTVPEAAQALGVSYTTVWRMMRDGTIKSVQCRPRGSRKSKRRIPADEIKKLAKVGTR